MRENQQMEDRMSRFVVVDVRGEAARIVDTTSGEIVAYVDPAGAQRMADQRNRMES
jgi:hypothetical protein